MSLVSRTLTALSFSFVVLIGVAGCGPRGETKSLDEVLVLARDRYQAALPAVTEADLRSNLDQISAKLESMSSASQPLITDATAVSQLLADLTARAGFTARPAITELSGQYRAVGVHSKVPSDQQSRIKLLVTRTYNLLASELESTQFKVS